MKKFSASILVLSAFFLFFLGPVNVQAIGISPPDIHVTNLLRGSMQKKSVTLFSGATRIAEDAHISVSLEGESKKAILLSKEEFIIPAGTKSYNYDFFVSGLSLPNGTYTVRMTFVDDSSIYFQKVSQIESSKETNTSAGVLSGANMVIYLTITGEQVVSYELREINVSNSEIGAPVDVKVKISNTGNVDWKPEKIVFQFLDTVLNTVVLEQVLTSKEYEAFIAGKEYEEISYFLNAPTDEGSYLLKADFYDKGAVVGSLTTKNAFNIFPKGTLAQKGEIVEVKSNKTNFSRGEKAKIDVKFKNTGSILTKAILFSSIGRGDKIIDLLRSQEYYVSPEEEVVMTQFLDLKDEGEYQIENYIEFGNKKTEPQILNLTVGGAGSKMSFGGVLQFLNSIRGIVLMSGVAVIFFVAKRFIKKKNTKPVDNKLKK